MRSVLFFFFFAVIAVQFVEASTDLRIATYNIWNPAFEEKYSGQNTWESRLPHLIDNLIASEADILLLQKVSADSYHDIITSEKFYNLYNSFYFSHFPSQPGQNEGRDGLAVFYKLEKMSDHRISRSKEGQRPTHRRDVYIDFDVISKEGNIRIRVATTHLDSGKDLTIGDHQLALLVEDVLNPSTLEKVDVVIVTGDFNEGEDEPVRTRAVIMNEAGFISDGSTESTRPIELDVRHKGHVDWIYFKKISGLPFTLTPFECIGNADASDHRLLITEMTW